MERMIALLHAQRGEAAIRAGLARDTADWTASSVRLDGLNNEIMHMGANWSPSREPIGDGLERQPDGRPADASRPPGVGRHRIA